MFIVHLLVTCLCLFRYTNAAVRDIYTVNGAYQPVQALAPGQAIVFDIVHASGDRLIEVKYIDEIYIYETIFLLNY
jgi:hypothetical protein